MCDEKYCILFVNISTTGCPLSNKKLLLKRKYLACTRLRIPEDLNLFVFGLTTVSPCRTTQHRMTGSPMKWIGYGEHDGDLTDAGFACRD